ncbi:holin family protein [Proteiniclasticum sp.]|uniref:phage holin family protein n=1 Tax=Proteiniclasticum sp. TaxID=2053595 RepID=UPI000E8574C0|nr:phage holin family protein [Proteiniclasticum sp.]HBW13776.1 hypothetical protein [Proteiniclasticum sp.]
MDLIKTAFMELFAYSKKEWSLGGIIACIGGVFSAMVGGADILFFAVAFAMAADIFTGIYYGNILKIISSEKGIKGIHKKVGIWIMIAFANMVDIMLTEYFGIEGLIRGGAMFFYFGMEGLSLIENLAAAGIIVYEPLREKLIQIKEGNKKGPSVLEEIKKEVK